MSEAEPGSSEIWGLVNDKVAHLGLYGILGCTLAWGGIQSRRRISPLVLVLVGIAYGALDEWHQSFVPGRTPSAGDLAADAAGVALGVVLTYLLFGNRIHQWFSDQD